MTFTPLMRAAKHGDVIEVRRLLESGADPNAGSGFYEGSAHFKRDAA